MSRPPAVDAPASAYDMGHATEIEHLATFAVLVQNEPGVLHRVVGLFAARGYNIDTLTVAATHDPAVSRLTLSLQCDDIALTQILQQTRKLVDVLQVAHPATALAA